MIDFRIDLEEEKKDLGKKEVSVIPFPSERIIPQNIPKNIRHFAKMLANGEDFVRAAKIAGVEKKIARKWMRKSWWRVYLRSLFLKRDDVADRVDGMIGSALDVKREILKDKDVDLDLRNKVASEVLKMRGFSKVVNEVKETFEMTQEFVGSVMKEFKSVKIERVREDKGEKI